MEAAGAYNYAFVALGIFMAINDALPGLLILLLACGFIAYLYVNTYYVIADGTLIVHTGFSKIIIDVATIRMIEETNTILSAPAFSLDRIEVFYNRYDSVVISPPDKTAFIAHLRSINNSIEVKVNETVAKF